jgi:hypothetical protein
MSVYVWHFNIQYWAMSNVEGFQHFRKICSCCLQGYDFERSVRSGKLLLGLASTVNLGFGTHDRIFFLSKTFMCF